MLYSQKLTESTNDKWHAICAYLNGAKYDTWLIPCRILQISPAELVYLLKYEFNAEIRYFPIMNYVSYTWDNKEDAVRWTSFINEAAQQEGFVV